MQNLMLSSNQLEKMQKSLQTLQTLKASADETAQKNEKHIL